MNDFDIYTNRVPFGLLTDEEKAALMAHDGAFEWRDSFNDLWRTGDAPSSEKHLVYRAVKPAPTPDEYPWDALDDRIVAVARDEDGSVWGFTDDRPSKLTGVVKGIVIGTCDWKDSLQIRPKGETK